MKKKLLWNDLCPNIIEIAPGTQQTKHKCLLFPLLYREKNGIRVAGQSGEGIDSWLVNGIWCNPDTLHLRARVLLDQTG